MYGFGLAIFKIITKDIENTEIRKNKPLAKEMILSFLLQFSAIVILTILTVIFSKIKGGELGGNIDALKPIMIFNCSFSILL